jgi:16S rRNA (guanine966-N2)-methyltransferase
MRVIAGIAKGRRLVGPDTRDTRPLTDRAKEAVFSSLGDRVVDAIVLDLYGGSGSIGIEALSRGARRVVFVEKGRDALASLRSNLGTLGFTNVAVIGQDVGDYLRTASEEFGVIFLDPPWTLPSDIVSEQMRAAARLSSSGAELVLHRRYQDPEMADPEGWSQISTRRYGDGRITRYERIT